MLVPLCGLHALHDCPDNSKRNIIQTHPVPPAQVVECSAPTGQGLLELEEALLLQAEVMELAAPVACRAEALVVEAHMDKGQGPVATVVVRKGRLAPGDHVVVGTEYGRVRAMWDSTGERAGGMEGWRDGGTEGRRDGCSTVQHCAALCSSVYCGGVCKWLVL